MINAIVLCLAGVLLAFLGHHALVKFGGTLSLLELAIAMCFALAGICFYLAIEMIDRSRFK